jgi:hypothetical protein
MAPEHEARLRVLYDHESEETGRRRRAVADWGVGEDIFDRMPSRRFTRSERRSAHSGTVVISREPEVVHGEVEPRRFAREPEPRVERAAPEPRREREIESWAEEESWHAPEPRRAESGLAGPGRAETALAQPGRAEHGLAEPPARLVAASATPVRTASVVEEPRDRRTVVISGHPGGLPVARPARPPKTALERVGARPDRIVAYAVALGFLLVLIAVLTTGQ